MLNKDEITIDDIQESIKNSLHDLYIPGTDILKPRVRMNDENDQDYENYLKSYYQKVLPAKEEIESMFDKVNMKPRQRLDHETDEEYNIYLEEYYNKIMAMKDLGEEENVSNKNKEDFKIRERKINESDEEYHNYLKEQYEKYFPTQVTPNGEGKIEGTNIFKPRDREVYETEEHYQKFLEEYYEKYFPTKVQKDKDEPIAGRQVNKPRDREPYETKEHYEKYLEGYYKDHVVPIPKLAFDKGKKHKIIAHKPNKKHKFLMKLLTIATFAVMGISALFGGKGNKKENVNQNISSIVKEVADSSENLDESLQDQIAKEVDKIMNKTQPSKIKVGDLVKFQEGTKYYYDSQRSKPTGTIGNSHTSKDSNYVISKIAVVNKEDNSIIATGRDKDLSASDIMKAYGVTEDDCRVMGLICDNDGKEEGKGWIKLTSENCKKTGNVYENKGKGK